MIWYRVDFPPVYITQGPYQDLSLQKYSDAAIQQALEAKGYRISVRIANMDRILHGLRSQEPACTTALLISPELAKTLEFSIPHSLTLPGAAVILKSRLAEFAPYMNKEGRLSLEAVIRDSALRLGVASGRGYSGVIDEVLKGYPQHPRIFRRKGEDLGPGLLRMLASRRIDYTIQFPWEAAYIARVAELTPAHEILSLPIQGMVDYVTAAGACPKNDWGREIIAIMNEAIGPVRDTPLNHELKEYWLDENSRRLYRQYWQELRQQKAQQPQPAQAAKRSP